MFPVAVATSDDEEFDESEKNVARTDGQTEYGATVDGQTERSCGCSHHAHITPQRQRSSRCRWHSDPNHDGRYGRLWPLIAIAMMRGCVAARGRIVRYEYLVLR